MTDTEAAQRLLDLTVEYAKAIESAESAHLGGVPWGRSPEEIAADYEVELRRIVHENNR